MLFTNILGGREERVREQHMEETTSCQGQTKNTVGDRLILNFYFQEKNFIFNCNYLVELWINLC